MEPNPDRFLKEVQYLPRIVSSANKQVKQEHLRERITAHPELFDVYLSFVEARARERFSSDHLTRDRIQETYVCRVRFLVDVEFIGLFSQKTALYPTQN